MKRNNLKSFGILMVVSFAYSTMVFSQTIGITATGSTSYPTTNVGNTNAGTALNSSNYLEVDQYTTNVPLTAIQIISYGTASGSAKVSIYTDASGWPGTLLFTEVQNTVTASSWDTATISNIYLAAGTYWIAFNINTTSAITHSTGITGAVRYFQSWTYATAFPATGGSTGWTLAAAGTSDCIYIAGVPVEGYAKATKATLFVNAAINSLSFYSYSTGNFRLAIYSDNSGPANKIWESSSKAAIASSWNTVNISAGTPTTLTLNSGTYWLVWQWDSPNSGPAYSAGTSGTGNYIKLAYGSYPSTWSGGTSTSENWSIYISYQATFEWTHGTSSDWQVPTNWTPTRTTTAINDILKFDLGGTQTVTNVPSQTISQLLLSNSSTVNLSAATAGNILTVNDALSTTASDVLNLGSGIVLGGTLTSLSNFGKIQTSVITSTSTSPIPAGKTWGGIVEYNGTGAQTAVGGTYTTLKINNSTGVSLGYASSITTLTIGDVAANSIFNDGGFTITPGSGSVLNLTSGTYNLGSATVGTSWPAWGTRNFSTGTTIGYISSVAQTISTTPSYKNLTLSGSGTKTFSAAAYIGGILAINGTALAALAAGSNTTVSQLILGGITEPSGTWGSTSSTATNKNNTYFASSTGYVTVSSGWISGSWVGSTSNDWNTGSNWVGGSIPGAATNVTIQSINNQPNIGLTGVTCNNITINSGASLTILAGNSLTVNGTLTNNAGNSGLILKSNASGTASLIHSSSGVSGTAERYIATDNIFRYHYISSPMSSASVMTIYDATYGGAPVYYYNPSVAGNWVYTGGSATLQPGVGFAVKYKHATNNSKTLSYTGTFSTGNINVNISNNDQDWNLVGNPYPASISSSSFLTTNASGGTPSIYGTLYLWDDDGSGGTGYSSSDYATCTTIGCTAGSQGHLPNGNISTGQAFFVQSKTKASNAISFTNTMKTTTNTQFFVGNSGSPSKVYLDMIDKNNNYNEIMFAFSTLATKGFDNMLDGRKLQGNNDLSFYSMIPQDTNGYVIQALPPVITDTIQLGFYTDINGTHTINLGRSEYFDPGVSINLYDKYDSTYTDLKKDSTYKFNSTAGTYNDRFYLIFIKLLPLNASVIKGNNAICQNQSQANFSIDPITNADGYDWSYDGKGVKLAANDNILYMNLTDSATSGILKVRGKNIAGYGDYTYLTITIMPLPGKALNITGPDHFCRENMAVLYEVYPIQFANTYVWTLTDGSTDTTSDNKIQFNIVDSTRSGLITVAGVNTCGVGELSSMHINIINRPGRPQIIQKADTLFSSSLSGNQWYENGNLLSNDTNKQFIPLHQGIYYVIATNGSCYSDSSNSINYSITSLNTNIPTIKINVYPNPVTDKINIEYSGKADLSVNLYDMNGKIIKTMTMENGLKEVNVNNLEKGTYILKVYNENIERVIKLVKE